MKKMLLKIKKKAQKFVQVFLEWLIISLCEEYHKQNTPNQLKKVENHWTTHIFVNGFKSDATITKKIQK